MINDEMTRKIADEVRTGNLPALRKLFRSHPDLISYYYGGYTWLHLAARRKNTEVLRLLIHLGCDVNARSKFGEFVIWDAIGGDNPLVVQTLLENGADPKRAEEPNRLILSALVSAKSHSLEMVKLLEQHGVDLHRVFMNELANEPMNALSTAIDWGKDDVAAYLRSRGAVMPNVPMGTGEPQSLADEVIAYFAKHFGPVKRPALIEIVPSSWPPVAVHVVPPPKEGQCLTLFTTGLSSEPMKTPAGEEDFQWAELFIQLPANWKYTKLEDPDWSWPIQWLRSNAQYPHVNQTWLGGPVAIIANGDPPKPLAPNTQFTCLLLLAEKNFVSRDGRTIHLYRMAPLYTEERDLELRNDIGALLRAFDRHGVPFIVKPDRLNVGVLKM